MEKAIAGMKELGNSLSNERPFRKSWIDFLRGLAMLLVIWGHIAKTERMFYVFTGPFKMPLFFAVTGYVFNDVGGNWRKFLKNLWLKIIIPWIVLSLIWIKPIYAVITRHPEKIPVYFYDFVSGKVLWFMPCIVMAECIYFCIRKYIASRRIQHIALALVSVLGIVMSNIGIGRFAMIDVACISQAFILFGYWFKNNEATIRDKIGNSKLFLLVSAYIALVFMSVIVFPGESIDVHNNRYYSYFLCGIMIFISLLTLFVAAPKIARYRNKLIGWIVFVGQNTLVFYIMHYDARFVIRKILQKTNLPFDSFFEYFVAFVFICSIMTIASLVINTWLPFAAGRKSNA